VGQSNFLIKKGDLSLDTGKIKTDIKMIALPSENLPRFLVDIQIQWERKIRNNLTKRKR